ncbi:MAG: signal peptidase I [Candidatus Paceibacterota bacterium]
MNEMTTEDRSHSDVESSSGNGFFLELLRTALIVALIVLPIRLFIAQPFIVSGASMSPTLDSGDYLVIDQISYRFADPQRNDVVVFRYPNNPSRFYIKRLIGLPGETVKIRGNEITIFNEDHPDGFEIEQNYLTEGEMHGRNVRQELSETEYFVLGDNRDSSSDSRIWGALPENNLIGRAYARLLPIGSIGLSPGQSYERTDAARAP